VFDNAKVILGNVLSTVKVKINAMSRPIKTVIVGYFLLVVVLVATYYIAWLYQWHNGQIVMSDLLAVIKEMIGPAMIGFMTFIAGCFIDMNNNGIPDKFEEDEKHEKNNLR
jgi:hypothetical protein